MPKSHSSNVDKRSSSNHKMKNVAILIFIALGVGSNLHFVLEIYQGTQSSGYTSNTASKKATVYKYFEVYNRIMEIANEASPEGMTQPGSNSAFSRATVIHHAPWLPRRRMCKETCCVQAVAISLDQDKQQLIHCRDTIDLADIHLPMFDTRADHMPYHAANFHEALLPCLVPA
jgi:hypothetical protein